MSTSFETGIIRECPRCGSKSVTVERRRLCTEFVDEENNWLESCEECFVEVNGMYEDDWKSLYDDIYAGLKCR